MESTNNNGIFKQINNLYNKSSFLEKYGLDVWTVIIVCLIFFCLSSYFYILNNIEPIKADWENQRCNPAVMPFAGLINKGRNDSNIEFTSKNFTGCVQSILTSVIAYAFQPIYYIMKTLTGSLSELVTSMNSTRAMFDKIRSSIEVFSRDTMGRALNTTMPIVQMIIAVKSMGAKMVGTLTASLFTLYGSYLTLQSLFAFILQLITTILIILAAIIAGLIIANVFAFGALTPVIALNTAIMIAILIPTIIIQIFMSDVLKLSSESLPSVPSCFSGDTLIEIDCEDVSMQHNKPISDIEIGDVLKGGEIVTAVMKLSTNGQDVYNINGVKVTGEHRTFHNTLGWIKVKEHPERSLINDFNEPFVYCLSTDDKTFTINGQLYSDWDDIDKHVYRSLCKFCSEINNNKDIHTYLDNGIIGTSQVKLDSGASIPIVDVKVDDILANGVKVIGVIKINATDIKGVYDYKYMNKTISGFNVNVCLGEREIDTNEIDTNEIDTNEIDTNEIDTNEIIDHREKYLYHLLTNTGYFTVNDIRIRDYNYGIDKYIEWSKIVYKIYNS